MFDDDFFFIFVSIQGKAYMVYLLNVKALNYHIQKSLKGYGNEKKVRKITKTFFKVRQDLVIDYQVIFWNKIKLEVDLLRMRSKKFRGRLF